jgi:hypothetical protein
MLRHLDWLLTYPLGFSEVQGLFRLTMPVVVLALLFTPAVRHHCAK